MKKIFENIIGYTIILLIILSIPGCMLLIAIRSDNTSKAIVSNTPPVFSLLWACPNCRQPVRFSMEKGITLMDTEIGICSHCGLLVEAIRPK